MSQLILFIACSLDGYIASTSGEVDWLFSDQDYGYDEFYATCDRLLIGRKTYEQLLTFGAYPYSGKQGYVFSRSAESDRDENVVFVSEDLVSFVKDLKSQEGKHIWLVGGAAIAKTCLENNLVDKFILSIHPIVLGNGIPLFMPPLPTLSLLLEHCQTFATGLVQLTYSAVA